MNKHYKNVLPHETPKVHHAVIHTMDTTIIAYSATSISILGRFIFMYLLYTRRSTNIYSLIFSLLNVVSSSLWVTYSSLIVDTPLLVRGSCDLVLFTVSAGYILGNRWTVLAIPEETAVTATNVTAVNAVTAVTAVIPVITAKEHSEITV